jgi:hypothetical protein
MIRHDQIEKPPFFSNIPGSLDAAALASDLDRRWFQANPGRHHRIRAAIAGETPEARAGDYVVVRQVRPDFRIRWGFHSDNPLPAGEAPEHVAAAIFDSILKERAPLGLGRLVN